jgi:hypothetical protein
MFEAKLVFSIVSLLNLGSALSEGLCRGPSGGGY